MHKKLSQIEHAYSKQQLIPLQNVQLGKDSLFIHLITHKIFKGFSVKIKPHFYQKAHTLSKWRLQMQPQFPIVKLQTFQIQQENRDNLNIIYFIQYPFQTIQTITCLNLSQALYVIKTGLVALEYLIEKFGFFRVLPSMIMINKNSIIKLWVNTQFQLNQKLFSRCTQQQTILDLLLIVENIVQKDQLSVYLFQQAKNRIQNIVKLKNLIKQFAAQNNITVPLCLFPQKRKSSLRNSKTNSTNMNSQSINQEVKFNNNSTVKQQNQIGQKQYSTLIFSGRNAMATVQRGQCSDVLFTDKKQKERRWKKKTSNCQNNDKALMSLKSMTKLRQTTMVESIQLTSKQKSERMSIQGNEINNNNCWLNSSLKFESSTTSTRDEIIQQSKKLMIMSTFNLKISSDSLSKQNNCGNTVHLIEDFEQPGFARNHQRKNSMPNNNILNQLNKPNLAFYNQDDDENRLRLEYEQKYKSNKWIRKISQLFDQAKDINESVRVDDDETPYLNDIKLQKLQQFGRFISQSLLELQQQQQENFQSSPNQDYL